MKNLKCSVMLICLSLFSSLAVAQEKAKKSESNNIGAGVIAGGGTFTGLMAYDEAKSLYTMGHTFQQRSLGGTLSSLTPKSIGRSLGQIQQVTDVEIHYLQRVNPGLLKRVQKFRGDEQMILKEVAHFEYLNKINPNSHIVQKVVWYEKIPSKVLNKAKLNNAISLATLSAALWGIAISNFEAPKLTDIFTRPNPSQSNAARVTLQKPSPRQNSIGKSPAGAKAKGL